MNLPSDSIWHPPEGVTRHSGSAIAEDLIFFETPPPEIGRLITADSTLTTAKNPRTAPPRLAAVIFIGLSLGVTCWFILRWLLSDESLPTMGEWIGLVLICGISIALTDLAIGFSITCSFVGEAGIAEATIKRPKRKEPTVKTILFQDISHLYTSRTREYVNGAYAHTRYEYRWLRSDKIVHTIAGVYYNENDQPKDLGNLWYLGNAAETAWTDHLLQIANQDLERLGYIEFPMSGNPQMVRVGQGFLEFVTRQGETQRVTVEDMKDVQLKSGQFYFKHKDTQWWSGKGKYSFAYGDMPNVALFWLCLHRLTGFSFS
ncbi:MAG: hypothetical protein AAF215_20445 [Cyanobacteria bacterium P01_A01_bin.123]